MFTIYQVVTNCLFLGEEEQLKYDHRKETPLLMSFIYEVMRYHTTVPLGVPHSSPCQVTVEGYTIPKGTPVS